MHIAYFDDIIVRTTERRPGGQVEIAPSAVWDQSKFRVRSPISPPFGNGLSDVAAIAGRSFQANDAGNAQTSLKI